MGKRQIIYPLLNQIGPLLHRIIQIKELTFQYVQQEALEVWLFQLSGPLPGVLQNPSIHAVRATGCDAISNIGPLIFAKLPVSNLHYC